MTAPPNSRRPSEWPGVSAAIRKTMAGNKGTNTKPELLLRSTLHAAGYRFRIHGRGLPGTPDLVFGRRKKAIWVHGCFWHSHPGCRFATVPKTRSEYWLPKLARNRERDAEHAACLSAMGWESLVVWECEMKDLAAVNNLVQAFLGPVRHPKSAK
jgi:DNA mismatch endonuclease, patch repair protein